MGPNRHRLFVAVLLLLAAGLALADQGPPVYTAVGTLPRVGLTCTAPRVQIVAGTGAQWCCVNSKWASCEAGAPTGASYVTMSASAGLSAEVVAPTCSAGQHLFSNGTALTCTADTGGGASIPSTASLLKGDGAGGAVAYGGGACTGATLVQSLSGAGAPTCYQLRLDQLADPTADIQWQFNGSKMEWEFTTPVDAAFTIHLIGAYTGDGIHLHQHSGTPGVGTDLFHGEWTSTNVTGLKLVGPSSAAQAATITGKVDVTGVVSATSFVGPLGGNASTATALAADPSDCTLPNVALGIGANGAAACAQPSNVTGTAAGLSSTLAVTSGGTGLAAVNANEVLVGTAANTLTAKSIPSCSNGTTSKLLYNSTTQAFSCGTDQTGGAGGGGNFVRVLLDFGAGGTNASQVVPATWVAADSVIVCSPSMVNSGSRGEGAEDAIIEGLTVAAHSRSAGVGFTLSAAVALGSANGMFAVDCTGGGGTVVGSLAASIDTPAVTGYCLDASSCTATTDAATCSGAGGTGSYTYAWSKVSGDTISPDSVSSAATTFSRTATTGPFAFYSAVYRCTVNDGVTTATADVSVSTQHDDGL